MCYQRCVPWRAWLFFIFSIYQSRCALIPTHIDHLATTDALATSHQIWDQVAAVQPVPIYVVQAGPPNVPWASASLINQNIPWAHSGPLNQGIFPNAYLTPFAQLLPPPAASIPLYHMPQPTIAYNPHIEALEYSVPPPAHLVITGDPHNHVIQSSISGRVASWLEISKSNMAAHQPHLAVTGRSLNAHAPAFNP
ncbi:hypothetical protein PCANC_01148 [Puccinia coronata f. sp. avenae]|uniref:Uncharacterized protein n=1 Tax=Puccinia coronata f. sp. avenae TaxID=200324 RepID=A0A2N5W5Y1_9BASI|nr:hypothetical protein PCANC_01148 [Puccinia coronata f. sp. avenae]